MLKSLRGSRLILDLSQLNVSIDVPPFTMTNHTTLDSFMLPPAYTASLALKDTFLCFYLPCITKIPGVHTQQKIFLQDPTFQPERGFMAAYAHNEMATFSASSMNNLSSCISRQLDNF